MNQRFELCVNVRLDARRRGGDRYGIWHCTNYRRLEFPNLRTIASPWPLPKQQRIERNRVGSLGGPSTQPCRTNASTARIESGVANFYPRFLEHSRQMALHGVPRATRGCRQYPRRVAAALALVAWRPTPPTRPARTCSRSRSRWPPIFPAIRIIHWHAGARSLAVVHLGKKSERFQPERD